MSPRTRRASSSICFRVNSLIFSGRDAPSISWLNVSILTCRDSRSPCTIPFLDLESSNILPTKCDDVDSHARTNSFSKTFAADCWRFFSFSSFLWYSISRVLCRAVRSALSAFLILCNASWTSLSEHFWTFMLLIAFNSDITCFKSNSIKLILKSS